jgi:nitrile hydratase accessory protein
LSISDVNIAALRRAEAGIPPAEEGPLFPQAWHARIFALVVALVENEQFSWTVFQARLAARTSDGATVGPIHPDDINEHYFGCWLAAAEETLVAAGLARSEDVVEKMEHVRGVSEEVRSEQLDRSRNRLPQ